MLVDILYSLWNARQHNVLEILHHECDICGIFVGRESHDTKPDDDLRVLTYSWQMYCILIKDSPFQIFMMLLMK